MAHKAPQISTKASRWRWARTHTRTLGLVAVSDREAELIRHTLSVLRIPQAWSIGPDATADALLVDVDSPAGRSRWWALRHARPRRPVIALTVDADLRSLEPVLQRPVRGDCLRRALERIDGSVNGRRAGTPASAIPAAELVVRCRHEQFRLSWPDGTRYQFDRPADRVYGVDSETGFGKRLFAPLGGGRLQPVRIAGNGRGWERLSRILTDVALDHPAPETLPWFDGNPKLACTEHFAPNRLPLNRGQQMAVNFLAAHGDMELLELVVAGGLTLRLACAVAAALYLNGMIRFE